ncbi:MAG TPA: MarR family winged helix-turn-helix transcriptional regulator [Longimicrobiales bacterium]|nr:MarR family winged helix-turn-helix transcriptional regulator [Longimicrobiales bacterium]
MSDVETVLAAYPRIAFACRPRHVRDPESGSAISAHQASVLSHLDEHDPTMVGELAEHLGVTASTMSLTLKRLERDGYVRRDRDPADRRVMNVRLTAAGARVRDAHTVLDPDLVVRMLAGMDAERRRDAVHGVRLLAEASDALVRSRRRDRDVETRIGGEGA